MTDRDALYRAILANPADDTPRLVYADWLEENNREEEAEFIRVQCQLEAAPPDQPGYVNLIEREAELQLWLTTHAPGPTPKFPAGLTIEGGKRWWELQSRGFPRFLDFDGNGRPGLKSMRSLAAAIEKAFTVRPTRWLVVRNVSVEQLAELLKQPVVAGLDRITLQFFLEEPAADEAARLIAACPRLQNLRGASLAFPMGEAGINALAQSDHLDQLRWLSLDTRNVTAAAIRSLNSSRWFRRLQTLTLSDGLASDPFEQLCRLDPCPRLRVLDLSNNTFAVDAWQAFAGSAVFPGLIDLRLNEADLSMGRMAVLARASGFNLSSIDLSYCAIGNAGAEALTTAPWAGSLRSLCLTGNRLTSSGMAALGGCRTFPGLKRLDLSYNTQGVGGLQAIGSNGTLRNLTTLSLSGDSGRSLAGTHFHEFLQKLNLPLLRQLNLTSQPLGPKAARLLTHEKFGNLTRLGLANCKLTDTAVRDLLASPTLQNLLGLNLRGNGLNEGVKALTDSRVLPRLASCFLGENRITAALSKKLARRPGINL